MVLIDVPVNFEIFLSEYPFLSNLISSVYCSFIIDTLNHDETVSKFLDPVTKINEYIEKYNLK